MITGAFMALPMMIIAFTFFIGFGLGNVGLILLFLGQITVVPAATYLLQLLSISKLPNYDICNLVPSSSGRGGLLNVGPSFWMAQFLFFIGYVLQNAHTLYVQVADVAAPEAKVQNRKEQALTAMIVTIVIAFIVVGLRLKFTGCETVVGTAVAAAIMIPIGVGWYMFAAACGVRNADVFGISSKILSVGATEPPPQVCVPGAVTK
jgi:hypothetical protein